MKKRMLKKLRVADYLSLSRFLAAIVLVVLAIKGIRNVFAWLLVAGFLTDFLDGYIARKRNDTTKHGAKLDSTGDAIIFLAALTGVVIFETDFFYQHRVILLATVGIYLGQLVLAFWRYGKASSFHTYAAKTAAFVQAVFLCATSFFEPWEWLFFIGIVVSILESIEEIILIFVYKKPVTNVKGLYWVFKSGKKSFK